MIKEDSLQGKKIKDLVLIREVAKTSFSDVYEAYDKSTHQPVTCRVIRRSLKEENPSQWNTIEQEMIELHRCKNDNIAQFIDSFFIGKHMYILTEFSNGGSLSEYLTNNGGVLSEEEALGVLRQILNGFKVHAIAIQGLHQVGIVHGFFSLSSLSIHNGSVKIAVGSTDHMNQTEQLELTNAPENFLDGDDCFQFPCDIWSIGIVYYMLLFGEATYAKLNDSKLARTAKAWSPVFPKETKVSSESKFFIERCLTVDPHKRVPWSNVHFHVLLQKPIPTDFQLKHKWANLKNFISFYNHPIEEFEKSSKQLRILDAATERMIKAQPNCTQSYFHSKMREYTQAYLNIRNGIALIMKYGILPLRHLECIPVDQSLCVFLLYKKMLISINYYLNAIESKTNFLGLQEFWEEFLEREDYAKIMKVFKDEHESVFMKTRNSLRQAKTSNPQTAKQLNLDTTATESFIISFNQQLKAFSKLLFEYRDWFNVDTTIVLKLVTFLCDTVSGVNINYRQYTFAMDDLDVSMVEARFKESLKAEQACS